jgi:hypothetical protein
MNDRVFSAGLAAIYLAVTSAWLFALVRGAGWLLPR